MTRAFDSSSSVADHSPWKDGTTVAIVLLLTGLGFYLRYRCLGCLGFRWDEDLTALAVKALVASGVPELPSGMIYTRFYPLQWVMALSTSAIGFSEFAMRLPSVVFSTLLIPTAYFMTRRLFDTRIALLITAAFALSFHEVEMARTARMYAPFFLVYLLASLAIFEHYYRDTDRLFSPAVMLLTVLALSLHQLAYSLAILLLLAIPLNPSFRRAAALCAQAALVGILFLVTKSIQEGFFYRGQQLAEQSGAASPVADGNGIIAAVLNQVALPDLQLFQSVMTNHSLAWGAIVLLSVLLSAWAWRSGGFESRAGRIVAVCGVLAGGLHQFSLAFILLALLLISGRTGIASIKKPGWTRPAMAVLLLLVAWVAALIWIATGDAGIDTIDRSWRKLARTLVDYPNFRLFWAYALEYPFLAPALLLGSLWALHGIATRRPDPLALFVGAGFWSVLLVNGILETQYEFFRYNLHLHWFFFALVITGIVRMPTIAAELGLGSGATSTRPVLSRRVLLVTAAVLTLIAVNPLAALLTSQRDYREDGPIFQVLDLDTYPDFATPAAYIRERLAPEDRLFTLDPREYWNYVGRVDYWIWSFNYESQTYRAGDVDRDLYLGIPVLHSIGELQQALEASVPGNAWIVYSTRRLDRTPWVSDEIKAFLRSLDDQVVYTGRDGNTVVVKLSAPAAALVRPADADLPAVTAETLAASQNGL